MSGNAWANRAGARGGAVNGIPPPTRGRARITRGGQANSGAAEGQGAQVQAAGVASVNGVTENVAVPKGNVWDARARLMSLGAEGGVGAQQIQLTIKEPETENGKCVAGNIWEARKRLQAMSVKDDEAVAGMEGMKNADVNLAVKAEMKKDVPKVNKSPSPVKSKESLSVVQEITPKLVMLGEATADQNRIRPFRPQAAKATYPPIPVKANHFYVNFDPKTFPKFVYHYDVVIAPKEVKTKTSGQDGGAATPEATVPDRLLHVIWRKFEETFHKVLGARIPFDGKKNCYTAKPLKLGKNNVWNDEITMVDPDDDDKTRTYRIQLKLANEVDTSTMFTYLRTSKTWEHCDLPQEVIQALDVALRYCPAINYTPCNRSFYSDQNPHNLSDMLELWFGHNQSLLLGREERATLNVDMANKAFMKRLPVERLLRMQLGINQPDGMMTIRWTPSQFRKAEEFIKGKLIEYGTGNFVKGKYEKHHRFVANKVVERSANSYSFPMNGKDITIQEYFQQEKGIILKHPEWPVVHVGNKNMTNYVPIELCQIVPQAYKGKLEAADTSEMIKGAAKPPRDRFQRIQTSRDNSNFEACPILKEFGIKVESQMVQMEATRLPKPKMNYRSERGNEETLEPKGADGKFMIGQFLEGGVVPKIGVLNACGRLTDSYRDTVKRQFLRSLGDEARKLGMLSEKVGTGRPPVDRLFTDAEYLGVTAKIVRGGNQTERPFIMKVRECLKKFKESGCGLVIVIIGKDGHEYPTIKNEAEVQVGILTQCVKDTTVRKITENKGAKQVIINILLKVNAKLGGLNFKLGRSILDRFRFFDEPVLILGADVTHPAPHSKSPSVAAITASYDLSGVCFQMHIQVQEAAEEVISGLKDLIVSMLKKFRQNTGHQPKRIIMFRDGVSEGQFPAIKEHEYKKGIVEACHSLNVNYSPKISFLVVKKRHHTRFLPTRASDAVAPKQNIPPGTCVDKVITHPTEMEFFLNSHVGIQGTSKPTRYHVLHDDSSFSMEDLELLTYCLCYTFVRCTQPVSYPAPTYYAHLAAFRARALLEKEGDNADLQVLQQRMTIHPDLLKKYPMFFV